MTAPYEPPRLDGPHPADRNALGETRLETVQRRLKAGYFADPDDLVWAVGEVEAARKEATRLRGLLRRLEWADHDRSDPRCPACGAYLSRTNRPGQHHVGCRLAAELGR